jgi:hypothetical protein
MTCGGSSPCSLTVSGSLSLRSASVCCRLCGGDSLLSTARLPTANLLQLALCCGRRIHVSVFRPQRQRHIQQVHRLFFVLLLAHLCCHSLYKFEFATSTWSLVRPAPTVCFAILLASPRQIYCMGVAPWHVSSSSPSVWTHARVPQRLALCLWWLRFKFTWRDLVTAISPCVFTADSTLPSAVHRQVTVQCPQNTFVHSACYVIGLI